MALNLSGDQRKQMIGFISQPLTVWLIEMKKRAFPEPGSSESCDMMAEAVADALIAALGPHGRAALDRLALDILDVQSKEPK